MSAYKDYEIHEDEYNVLIKYYQQFSLGKKPNKKAPDYSFYKENLNNFLLAHDLSLKTLLYIEHYFTKLEKILNIREDTIKLNVSLHKDVSYKDYCLLLYKYYGIICKHIAKLDAQFKDTF